MFLNLTPEVGFELASTDDAAREPLAAIGQQGTGLDQIREAFLFDEPTHSHDPGRAAARLLIGEALERQPVVDALHARRNGSKGLAQELEIKVADRDDRRGIGQLPSHVLFLDTLVEDVLGVGRESVRKICEGGGEARDRGGHGREVRMQMADAPTPCFIREGDRLRHIPRVLAASQLELAPEAGQDARGRLQSGPELGGFPASTRYVCDRRPHAGDGILEAFVGGRAQRKDLDIEACGFVRDDLVHDEGFRVAWVSFDDVGNLHARSPQEAGRADRPGSARADSF